MMKRSKMSADSSPVVADLKSRLQKQALSKDGQGLKGSPPISEKSPGIGKPSPLSKVKPLTKPEVWGGNKSPNIGGSTAKPKPAPLFPAQKGKTGSPGAVREGWQAKAKDSPPQNRSAIEAKSTLAKVLQSRPDFVRGQGKESPLLPGPKKLGNSLESSNSEDEDSCFIAGKKAFSGGKLNKTPAVVCRESVSSADSDACDISGQDVCRLPGSTSRREGELVSSRSEENIAMLTGGGAKCGRASSVLSSEGDAKRKPLPNLPKTTQNSGKPLSVNDKLKSASTSNLKDGSATPPTLLGSKPQVAKTKPALPGGKPTNTHLKDTSPSHSLKPKPPANKPKPGTPKLVSKSPMSSLKPVENRQKPLIPANSLPKKSDLGSKSPANNRSSGSSTAEKKTCMLPPSKPSKPLNLKGSHQNGVCKGSERNSLRDRRSSSPEELSMDSHEVIIAILNTPDEEMLNSDLTPNKVPKKEDLENTLTNSQTRDLESTLVGTTDSQSGTEWVMVRKKKEEEEGKGKGERNTWSGGEGTTSAATGTPIRKLPSTPVKKHPPNNSTESTSQSSTTHSSPGSGSSSPGSKRASQPPPTSAKEPTGEPNSPFNSSKTSKSSKINALMDKFSGPNASPPPQPCRVYGAGKTAVATIATETHDNKPKPPAKPSGGVAKVEVAAAASSGPSTASSSGHLSVEPSADVPQEKGGASNRGNTDSGFISEAPDDLGLRRDMSVESLPGVASLERGGAATPSSPGGVTEAGEDGSGGKSEEAEKEVKEEVWDTARLEKARKKRLNIVKELLDTEKTYSGRIKVVAVEFYDVVMEFNKKSKQGIPEAALLQIFLNIRPIYSLSEKILQDIQQRFDAWSTEEALGDVISRLAPFLKLYSTYTSGFEDAMKTLTELSKKDRKFDALVREFEKAKISTGLGLSSYMLEPVQRIPRYRLLLLDYLKYLPPDSPDKAATEKALSIISEAADRSNNRIKELENSNELLSIQRSLVDYEGTLLVPSRSFIMKGALLKSSRKSLVPRVFFLFSDVLLHTYPAENNVFKFRNEMALCGMQVEDPKVSLMPFSFNIYSTTRSLILVACSEEEKLTWISSLKTAIENEVKKTSSLKRDPHLRVRKMDNIFGTKAPLMVPDRSVTMCQTCGAEFTMLFRRHHCRACGKVVCGDCSKQKAYLPYIAKLERVCSPCFIESKNPAGATPGEDVAEEGGPSGSPVTNKKDSLTPGQTGVLNLCGYDEDAVVAGYVTVQDSKKSNRMWYQVKRDLVLYKFKAHEDIKAITSMPLPGYTLEPDPSTTSITLKHPSGKKNLCDTFKVDGTTAYENWVSKLTKVINMELDSTPSSSTVSPLVQSLDCSSEYNKTSSRPSSRTLSSSNSRPSSKPGSREGTPVSVNSRPNSFSTASSTSRPSSLRESSPPPHAVFKDSFESLS